MSDVTAQVNNSRLQISVRYGVESTHKLRRKQYVSCSTSLQKLNAMWRNASEVNICLTFSKTSNISVFSMIEQTVNQPV